MNINKKSLYLILSLLFGLGVYFGLPLFSSEVISPSVTNYDECVQVNGQITLMYPAQCTYNGQTFVQQIANSDISDQIMLEYPIKDTLITSPLTVKGKARGSWFFEGSFLITLNDSSGTEITHSLVTTNEDWMNSDFIDFSVELSFTSPDIKRGELVLQKSNPSGLAEKDINLTIPVVF